MSATVHAHNELPNGTPAQGVVVVTVNTDRQVIRDPAGNVVFQGPATIGLVDGEATFTLPGSDDDTLEPSGFTFTATEQLKHVARGDYREVEFQTTDGQTHHLADFAGTDEVAEDPSYGANLNGLTARVATLEAGGGGGGGADVSIDADGTLTVDGVTVELGTDSEIATAISVAVAAAATPDASTTVKGKVELATNTETTTGTDTVRAVTPAGLAAALAIAPASKFRDDICAYNFNGTNMRKWNTAYAKAKNGEGRATICLYGDSVTSGYQGTSPQYDHSWPAHVRSLIEAKTGVVTGTGFVKPTALEEDAGEDRFFYTGTWSVRGSGLFAHDKGNNSGGKVTIGPITTDRIRVYFLKYSGGGTATTKVDTVAAASIATNQASGFTVAYQDFTATQGTHTLEITAPTGSDFILLGWEASKNGTSSGVRINNVGFNGERAVRLYDAGMADLSKTGAVLGIDVLAPDLAFFSFGLNELGQPETPSSFKAQMQALIDRLGGTASVVLLVPPPPNPDHGGGAPYLAYVAKYYELADDNNCALIDTNKRFISFDVANAQGLMFDGQHPTDRGYWDMGHLVTAALLATTVV